jgi:methylmalonyl-CoA mutase N-terminal domain/subunit
VKIRFHTQTGGVTLAAQQPHNNIVRVALQGFAAVCGGTQSLHTNGFDEALALPSETSARIALRTQQILAHESGIAATADPAGGSYVIEELTDSIERAVWAYLERIDAMGGMLAAIERGFIQGEIQNAAYEDQRKIESGERIVVGVNRFRMEGGKDIPTFRLDPALEQAQISRLRAVRASRSVAVTEERLDRLETVARSPGNLLPSILEAADSHATVGEISDRLRRVFGEYRDN